MQLEKRIVCHPAFLQTISESEIIRQGCVSICNDCRVEQMIFLIPASTDLTEFEVRVYKAHPSDSYVPNQCDINLIRYTANDEFASFFFDNIIFARHFIRVFEHNHPEFKIRPKFQA